VRRVAAGIGLAVLLVGCGGDGGPASLYAAEPTLECLRGHEDLNAALVGEGEIGLLAFDDETEAAIRVNNLFAAAGGEKLFGGALYFQRTTASAIERAGESAGDADAEVRRIENVVVNWDRHAPDEARVRVEDCLRSRP
jgi:hypothetical protein